MTRKARKPKRPEGYRNQVMFLNFTKKEKELILGVKEKYNNKKTGKISVPDLIVMAIQEFSKNKKLAMKRAQTALFE